ncbi:hypothetical protein PGT21_006120 [Puccinia graminis f. sp. tritici]|uniref:Uncharacterized protein n=1 Tax=Puccinia graminis f. sp. tritici TaxID=56615 RepID=A0A5B0QA69_PUCGR|nr:hypothetical protein PGT21_006120 [Puccinia graminis f. sp. tritici]
MMDLRLIQSMIDAQSAALATNRQIQTILADTVNIVVEDEDNENQEPPKRGRSRPGRLPNLP